MWEYRWYDSCWWWNFILLWTANAGVVAEIRPMAPEKHVPVIEAQGSKVTVKVGSVTHPMLPEHFIQWLSAN